MMVIMHLPILSPIGGSFFIPQIFPENLLFARPRASGDTWWQPAVSALMMSTRVLTGQPGKCYKNINTIGIQVKRGGKTHSRQENGVQGPVVRKTQTVRGSEQLSVQVQSVKGTSRVRGARACFKVYNPGTSSLAASASPGNLLENCPSPDPLNPNLCVNKPPKVVRIILG